MLSSVWKDVKASCMIWMWLVEADSPHLSPCGPAVVHRRVLLPDDLQRQLGQPVGEQVVYVLLPRPPCHLHSIQSSSRAESPLFALLMKGKDSHRQGMLKAH